MNYNLGVMNNKDQFSFYRNGMKKLDFRITHFIFNHFVVPLRKKTGWKAQSVARFFNWCMAVVTFVPDLWEKDIVARFLNTVCLVCFFVWMHWQSRKLDILSTSYCHQEGTNIHGTSLVSAHSVIQMRNFFYFWIPAVNLFYILTQKHYFYGWIFFSATFMILFTLYSVFVTSGGIQKKVVKEKKYSFNLFAKKIPLMGESK